MSEASIEVDSGGPIVAPQGKLFGESIAAWRERTRRELGITAAIVTAAGHQAFLWHPGILAKFVQARRLAGDEGPVVHLVVDHDVYEPALVRVPVHRDGALAAVTHRFATAPPGSTGAVDAMLAMARPAFAPRAYDGPAPASSAIAEGLERARAALDASRDAANAPMQVASALSLLMERWAGRTQLVAASALLRTTLGGAFIDLMRRDPRRCAESFNLALAAEPRAARPLREGADPELPIWTLGAGGRRERVTASRLAAAAPGSMWLPLAFLLSAFMRLGVADRFVHGTGARRYERATEAWLKHWLGIELPPIDIATATLRLPLADDVRERHAPVTPQVRRRAWWDPESLDGLPDPGARVAPNTSSVSTGPGPQKSALLSTIAALPRRSSERRAAYRHLHERLEALRRERAAELARLGERVAADRATAAAVELARDRTWPFVYFDQPSLDALCAPRTSDASPSPSARGSGR